MAGQQMLVASQDAVQERREVGPARSRRRRLARLRPSHLQELVDLPRHLVGRRLDDVEAVLET
jgi:hypothetical protein